jgi:outer membrane murein-binding lipoprotein Lpp
MKNLKKMMFATAIVAGLVFVGCNKSDEKNDTNIETSDARNDALAESVFDEVQEIADQAYAFKVVSFKSTAGDYDDHLSSCVTITLDTTVMPRILTIDFGEENCLCRDGKYRRGQIIVTFNGRYLQPGTVITHNFNNFYMNDNHIEGLKTLTNNGFNDAGFMWFSIVVNGQITLIENGNIISWSANKTKTWIEGGTTPRLRDDVYLLEGNATSSNSNGSGFTRIITTPLRRELSCRWFVSGTVEITPNNRPVRLLDYGDGNCDNLATVTINGETFNIILR